MPFVKLDSRILESSLWAERDPRDIFVTALLMAEPREIAEPLAQLEVRTLRSTGFVVPPGWYGFIASAGIGIIRRSLLGDAEGYRALDALGNPDPESRSDEFEGRRLVRVDGGYIVLNFMKYRDRDYTAAERMKRLRERKKGETAADVTRNERNVRRNVTQAEDRVQSAEDREDTPANGHQANAEVETPPPVPLAGGGLRSASQNAGDSATALAAAANSLPRGRRRGVRNRRRSWNEVRELVKAKQGRRSQSELAKEIDISQGTLSAFMTGKNATSYAVAAWLKIPYDEIQP